jgi:hypothetical protein
MANFKPGDKAYILESNRMVTEVTVKKCAGGLYMITMPTGGAIKVKKHRLYATLEEAENALPRKKEEKTVHKLPYDYM